MTEIYNKAERAVILLTIYLVSFLASLIYFCYRVDFKKTSCLIFIICLIYASLFCFLNIISIVDLVLNSEEGFTKLMKFIQNFYKVFTWVDKVSGFKFLIFSLGIFDFYVYIRESGYHSYFLKRN